IFFSSRRRHTRLVSDWSSDVCSSDLEFVVRAALGASRGRLLRQAVTEGAMMSGAVGILGLWLASAGVRALIRAYPTSVPRTSERSEERRVGKGSRAREARGWKKKRRR